MLVGILYTDNMQRDDRLARLRLIMQKIFSIEDMEIRTDSDYATYPVYTHTDPYVNAHRAAYRHKKSSKVTLANGTVKSVDSTYISTDNVTTIKSEDNNNEQ